MCGQSPYKLNTQTTVINTDCTNRDIPWCIFTGLFRGARLAGSTGRFWIRGNCSIDFCCYNNSKWLTDSLSRPVRTSFGIECNLQTFAYCERLIFIRILCNLPDTLNSDSLPPESCNKEYFTQLVRNNTTVLDWDSNWYTYYIKGLTPFPNKGLKSSRELCLFFFSFVSSLSLLSPQELPCMRLMIVLTEI